MTEVRNDAFQILGFHGLDDYRLKDKTNQDEFKIILSTIYPIVFINQYSSIKGQFTT